METGSNNNQQLAQAPMAPRGRQPRVPSGMLWMLLGCMTSFMIPFLGLAVLAYGAREMVEAKGSQGFLLACGTGLVIAAMAFISDFVYGVTLVAELLSALGIVWCMRNNRSTVLGISAVIVGVALFNIGVEAALAATSGSSLDQVIDNVMAMVIAAAEESFGTNLEADMLIQQMTPVFRAIWPFIYVGASAMDALAAGVGSFLMRVRTTGVARTPAITTFDMPLWAVGVLAASIVGLGVASSGIPGSNIILTVSATTLLSVRFIFAIQGFAVATHVANRFRLGCLGRVLLVFLSLQLETLFFALSIVGLIDVWANFRKLPRGGFSAKAHT